MMNYLSRRESPLRLVNFMPGEVIAFGERVLLDSLESRPPDVVFLVQRDTSDDGYPRFGTTSSYGQQVVSWVRDRHRTTAFVPEGSEARIRLGD